VAISIVIGDAAMDGEDDETFTLNLAPEGNGVYSVRSSIGGVNQSLVSGSLSVKRGGESWGFFISRGELGLR
jgi:hypothetical protein